MEIETPIASPALKSEATVGNLFDTAMRETANPSPPQQEAPKIVEAPKAEEPKVEKAVEQVAEVPKAQEPKKGDEKYKWGELKKKADEYDAFLPKLTEAEKRVQEYEKKAAETEAKYKALEDEKKGYESELTENRTWRMAFDLENTPEYQNAVTRPFTEAQSNIENLAAKFEIDANEMWKIATEVDEVARLRGIHNLLRDHEESPVVKDLLSKQIEKLDKARDAHTDQVNHAEGLRNQINARQHQQQQEKTIKQQEEEHKARTESWGLIKESLGLPEIFDSSDPTMQAQLKEIQEAVLEDTPMGRSVAARAMGLAGLLAKQLRETQTRMKADIEARDKTIADISGSRPGAFRPSSPSAPKQTQDAGAAFDSAMSSMGMRSR